MAYLLLLLRNSHSFFRKAFEKDGRSLYNLGKTNLQKAVTSMSKMIDFLKTHTVLAVSMLAAIISAFLVPPSAAYMGYLDYRVLSLLFCLMTLVAGLSQMGVFSWFAQTLCGKLRGLWSVSVCLILLCFFSSMIITNDVALITFVPFAVLVLSQAGQQEHLCYVIVLQTAAANLGSMLTPIGNPQNLYLYSKFAVSAADFFAVTVPMTFVGLAEILLLTLPLWKAGKKETAGSWANSQNKPLNRDKRIAVYLGLFCLCLGTVFHLIHWGVMLGIVLCYLVLFDRNLLYKADYPLLLTFVCFFVFVGNVGQIQQVRVWLGEILTGREMIISVLLSQVISNVPAAVMLSGFTENWSRLIVGSNVGGLGTLIASLASLISFQRYMDTPGANGKHYLAVFTAVNLILLVPMLIAALFVC